VRHAAMLYNMVPHSSLGFDSPFFRWFGTVPDGQYLHIWGSKCIVNTTPELQRNYIIPPGQLGTYIGVDSYESFATARVHVYKGQGTGTIVRSGQVKYFEETNSEIFLDRIKNDALIKEYLGPKPSPNAEKGGVSKPLQLPIVPLSPVVSVVEPKNVPKDFKLKKILDHGVVLESVKNIDYRTAVFYCQVQTLDRTIITDWYRLTDLIKSSNSTHIVGNWTVISRYIKSSVGPSYDEHLFKYYKVNRTPGRSKVTRFFKVYGSQFDVTNKRLTVVYLDGATQTALRNSFTLLNIVLDPPFFEVKGTGLNESRKIFETEA